MHSYFKHHSDLAVCGTRDLFAYVCEWRISPTRATAEDFVQFPFSRAKALQGAWPRSVVKCGRVSFEVQGLEDAMRQ